MEATVRLRLLIEDERILTDQQKSDGLDRCWILLTRHLATVSDLASHLTRSFSLHSSCPDGLILSMDEFVLPPFESISVFKDKDLVRVWKKDVVRRDAIVEGDNNILAEDAEVVEKQPILLCDKHLAIKDSGRESIEDLLDVEEDADGESKELDSDELKNSLCKIMSRKRKRSSLKKSKKVSKKLHLLDPFHIARRKKIKLKKDESHAAPLVEGLESAHGERHVDNLEKSLYNDGKLPDCNHGVEKVITTFINGNPKDVAKSNIIVERSHHIQEAQNDRGGPQATDVLKKFPSRSARRKKAKRRLRRELANSEKEKVSFHERTSHQTDGKDQATVVDVEKDKEIVPVVVKPGHIRFELPDEDGQTEQQTKFQGIIQWNGTLDKKKGQKWGREKTSTSEKTEKVIDKVCGLEDGSKVAVGPVDFEKCCPLIGSPKVGDVVAYRLVELTSSWCPEISTFRVGKVSFFDPETRNSILVPIPGYPIPSEQANEESESEMQPGNSLYKEDGSLEIEFTSLIDVRLFQDGSPEAMMATSRKIESNNEASPANSLVSASSSGANRDLNNAAPASAGKEIVGWDEISEVLDKKKAELLQKNGASCEMVTSIAQNHATKLSWSYRALRGSALGPTISLLRANNQL